MARRKKDTDKKDARAKAAVEAPAEDAAAKAAVEVLAEDAAAARAVADEPGAADADASSAGDGGGDSGPAASDAAPGGESGGDPLAAAPEGGAPDGGADDGVPVAVAEAGLDGDTVPTVESPGRFETIIEGVLFAADKPLGLGELKRILGERDGKKITSALEALRARHESTGIILSSVAGGWQFRTHPDCAYWVSKVIAGKPVRLSRAQMETLAIIAYRQPITRPEIDEIRIVDCGPVLQTLLERGLIRIIGRKEEVGRPMLYSTTPEFLRLFNLKTLTDLPTLQEFHELNEQNRARVEAEAPARDDEPAAAREGERVLPPPTELAAADGDEDDALIQELDEAAAAAARAVAPAAEAGAVDAPEGAASEAAGASGAAGESN